MRSKAANCTHPQGDDDAKRACFVELRDLRSHNGRPAGP